MNKQGILFGILLNIGVVIGAAVFLIITPTGAYALSDAANAICFETGMCQYGTRCGKNGPPGVLNKPCHDETNGLIINGKCVAPFKCEGVSGQGAGGEGMQAVTQALGQLMQQLMKGGGGGGGGGGFDMSSTTEGTGCVSYYQTSVPSSDPCAIYSPSAVLDSATGGTSGVSGSLLDALKGGSNTSASGSGTTNTETKTAPANTGTAQQPSGTDKAAAPGLSGDVRIGSAGATIIANLRQGLSEVAGFFGGTTGGASQALSAAARLCSSRPWAGSFVGNVIPSSFFDGLCEWRGYQAGVITPANTAKTTNTAGSVQTTSRPGLSLQPAASDVPPEVDMWAEPASVRLGTRTYIFWNARGVVSCKSSGPSFSQNSLSGGASTVPITGPTTFNIECLTSASTTVKDSVTVQIAI